MFEPCPCGSGASYLNCCGRLHQGQGEAETPEALMRSRYSAFAKRDAAYLMKTWSRETRPSWFPLPEDQEWTGLVIEGAEEGADGAGTVRFSARWRRGPKTGVVRETSRFRREDGAWRYVDGKTLGPVAKRRRERERKGAAR